MYLLAVKTVTTAKFQRPACWNGSPFVQITVKYHNTVICGILAVNFTSNSMRQYVSKDPLC